MVLGVNGKCTEVLKECVSGGAKFCGIGSGLLGVGKSRLVFRLLRFLMSGGVKRVEGSGMDMK